MISIPPQLFTRASGLDAACGPESLQAPLWRRAAGGPSEELAVARFFFGEGNEGLADWSVSWLDLTPSVLPVCAWCETPLVVGDVRGFESITHGICAGCLARAMEGLS